ncbi:solute carrier organic anion transporter family member 4C1 [Podarcis raffonei]|uniref:solute carrier organic anion transporter family member 4C1 n=1 Tax=Podarcis raffonei TaxID=65483 RepID=UPI0023290BE5|nr:solute carrier organic anion transporter family member 4C1 [Podarcis raffonei]
MNEDGVDNPAFEPSSPEGAERKRAALSPGRLGHPALGASCSLDPDEHLCGIGRFAPAALQVCNNPKGYLLFYSLLSIFQGIVVNGLVNVSISTIEKRYDLNSSLTGIISSGYDISFCLLCLFISFYGERGHKPRWLAFASFLIALGALVFCLPHFTAGPYIYGEKVEDTCPVNLAAIKNATCKPGLKKTELSHYFYVFLLGQLIMGAGGTPLYTLGTAFIDDSVPKHKSSVYIGIGYAMSLMGPAIGYVLGGQLLNIYVDFHRQPRHDITPEDPRWVGAWWVAFVACSFSTCLLVAPFSYFPKQLPGTHKIRAEKISEAHHGGADVQSEYGGRSLRDFLLTLWMLLRNPVLMCLVLAASMEACVATGFATFLPKFIENQFGYTSSYSATLGGLVLVPGAAIGQIISGILVSKLKLNCKSILKFIVLTCSVALGFNMVFLIAICGNTPFAGVSEDYNGTGTLSNLTAPCNSHCRCLRSNYLPVCGTDGVQYFSACYAGCTSAVTIQDGSKVFTNCDCVVNPKSTIENIIYGATPGKCASNCSSLALFLGFFFFTIVFTFMAVTPTTVAILRCVPERHRSFAMGVHMLFLRILGSIPGPILFGVSIDSTCTLWDIDKCGRKGSCWTYNNHRMAYMLVGISVIAKVISIVFTVTAVFIYNPPPEQLESSEKKEEAVTSVQL